MYTPGEYVGQDVFFFTVSVLVLILTPVLLAASELLPPNINIAANIIRAAITQPHHSPAFQTLNKSDIHYPTQTHH